MSENQPVAQPTKESVLASLAAAAEAAHQAYMAALAANPGADLSQLYMKEMVALRVWSTAENQALKNDPAIGTAQNDLDSATKIIRNGLSTIKDISTWLSLLDNLVKLADTVGSFFA